MSILFSGTFANDAGGGASESVTVSVTIPYTAGYSQTPLSIPEPPKGPLAGRSAPYAVLVNPSQPCMWSVSDESPSGFTVTLLPQEGATLSSGTIFVAVIG